MRSCRTAALGGHLYQCDTCGQLHHRYHSCRNRHCSQCQYTQTEQWIAAQEAKVLPVPYYHIVFTVPSELHGLFYGRQRQMYALLMRAAWSVIDDFGWNHRYLGAQTGCTMTLHTWGSNLSYHPHVHCIVPGGGITLKDKWKDAKGKGKFLYPVKGMMKVYRYRMLQAIRCYCKEESLTDLLPVIAKLYSKKWVVYAKPPFGGSTRVIRYLARYTHKIAITHHRIQSYDGATVRFRYTDYRHQSTDRIMNLRSSEFVRRLSMHILPHGFCRLRHYGILSGRWASRLGQITSAQRKKQYTWDELLAGKGVDVYQCPACKTGTLVLIADIPKYRGPPRNQHQQTTSTMNP